MFISGITSARPKKYMHDSAGRVKGQAGRCSMHRNIIFTFSSIFFYFTRSDVNTGKSRRKEAGDNSSFITSLTTLLTFSQLHAAFHVVPKYQIFLHFSFLKAELCPFQAFKTCPFVLNRISSVGKIIMLRMFFSHRLTDMS